MKIPSIDAMIGMTLLCCNCAPGRLAAQSKYRVVELGELGGTARQRQRHNDRAGGAHSAPTTGRETSTSRR